MGTSADQKLRDQLVAQGYRPELALWLEELHRLLSVHVPSLTQATLLRMLRRHFEYSHQQPQTLHDRIVRGASLLGVTVPAYVKAGIRQPQFHIQEPNTILARVKAGHRQLGISQGKYIKLGMLYPSLLTMRPERLAANVQQNALTLGVDRAQYLRMAINHGPLFYMAGAGLRANAVGAASLLGVPYETYLAAMARRGALLAYTPNRIHNNARRGALSLGVPDEDYIAAAMRQPSLLALQDANLVGKRPLLEAIAAELGDKRPFTELLRTYPTSMMYSAATLQQRLLLVRDGYYRKGISGLLSMPASRAAQLLAGPKPA